MAFLRSAFICVLITFPAAAGTDKPTPIPTTGQLLQSCRGSSVQSAVCDQFLYGVMIGYGMGQKHGAVEYICPDPLSAWDVEQVFEGFALAHPRTWSEPGPRTLMRALVAKFPCR
jgi:hypothetical protein